MSPLPESKKAERPILFSGPMVRAILEGRKTQTRRVMKRNVPEPIGNGCYRWRPDGGKSDFEAISDSRFSVPSGWADSWCPYGMAGDRLWVRETWSNWDNGSRQVVYAADRETREVTFHESEPVGIEPERFNALTELAQVTWRPSIFMPRWASRITLEVTEVRVQRVQEITEDDAKAEGVDEWIPTDAVMAHNGRSMPGGGLKRLGARKENFQVLWDSINLKRGFGWDANPWVWCVTFGEGRSMTSQDFLSKKGR